MVQLIAHDIFNTRILPHRGSLVAYLFRKTHNMADAEDLLQEVFLKAWRHLDKFDLDTDSRAWLFTIARYVTIDWRRRRMAHGGRFKHSALSEFLMAQADDSCENSDVIDYVLTAMVKLPEVYRETFALLAIDGQMYEQAAVQLAVPLGTVKTRYMRAKGLLREMLRPEKIAC